MPAFLRFIVCGFILIWSLPIFGQTSGFTMSPSFGCFSVAVNFSSTSTGVISSLNWDLGNGVTTSGITASTTYTSPGKYVVTLAVVRPGITDTVRDTVRVYAAPSASFSSNTQQGCPPYPVSFSATVIANAPGPVSYLWDFGDGLTDTAATPTHVYTNSGNFTVSLTTTNSATCPSTTYKTGYITIWSKPSITFTASTTAFCSKPATTIFSSSLTGGTSPFSYAWSFGDNSTGVGANNTHTYNSGGNFSVVAYVTDAHSCTDSFRRPNYIFVDDSIPSFTFSTPGCSGVPVFFQNTTQPLSAVHWDFGTGDTAFGLIANHPYTVSVPTFYTVSMTTKSGLCPGKTVTKQILVHPLPTGTITQIPAVPCPAPALVKFVASGPPGATFNWTWVSGGSATGDTVSKNYTHFTYNDAVQMQIIDTAGCTASISKNDIRVRDLCVSVSPNADPFSGACLPDTVKLSVTLSTTNPGQPVPCGEIYPDTVAIAHWTLDNGQFSNDLRPITIYDSIRLYHPSVSIITSNGCPGVGNATIRPDTPVLPSFYATPLIQCPKVSIDFVNTTRPSPYKTTYVWGIIGDTSFYMLDTTMLVYGIRKPGVYSVILFSNHNGCTDSVRQDHYITIHPPKAGFRDSVYCAPSKTVKFFNTTAAGDHYRWFFGDNTSDTATNPLHTYPAPGTYTIIQVAFNNQYGCTDTFLDKVDIYDEQLSISSSDSAICTKDLVTYFGKSTYPFNVTYTFHFGQYHSPSDTFGVATYSYDTVGYHDVVLIARFGNNCLDSLLWKKATLVAYPAAKIVASPPIGCDPMYVVLSDSTFDAPGVPPISKTWSPEPGDTVHSNAAFIPHIYHPSGRYLVYLSVTDSLGCTGNFIDTIISVFRPSSGFRVSKDTPCYALPLQFTDTSKGRAPLHFNWSFGDGTSDTARNPLHRYLTQGFINSRLIVTDSGGCKDTTNYPLVISRPNAAFTQSDTLGICPPLAVTFTNQSIGNFTYAWNFGNGGGGSVVPNPTTTYQNSGIYQVSLVVTNSNGCTDTSRSQVRVLGYNGAFSYTPLNGCLPMAVHFTPSVAGIPKIRWDFQDGSTDSTLGTGITHTYLKPGAFLPRVIFSDSKTCPSTLSIGSDTLYVDKVTSDFNWTVPCMGVAFTLNQQSSALFHSPVAWFWNFQGTDTSSGAHLAYSFPSSGNHQVTLISQNAIGCRDTITKQIFINPLPRIVTSADTAVCPRDTAHLYASGGRAYSWSPKGMINCISALCDTVSVQPAATMYYTVTVVDSNNCKNSDSVKVSIQIKTTDSTGSGGSICIGESFQLHAAGAQQYSWTPAGSLSNPHIANPVATPTNTTTYTLAAQEGSCLISYTEVTVGVNSLPIFSAGPDQIMGRGTAVTLHPTQTGIDHILWRVDSTLSCLDCFLPNAHPRYTHVYYATGYDKNGCATTDSVTVYVRCNGDLVYIPNTFSPNGDGNNDYFFPRGQGVDLMTAFRIFNRWGEMVFERNNILVNDEHAGWDGTFRGKELPPDVYVYIMQSRCEDGTTVQWKGDITLMR